MGDLAERRAALERARSRFAADRGAADTADATDPVDSDSVAPEVLASWRRCRDGGQSPQPWSRDVLAGDSDAMLDVARPILSELAELAAGEDYLAALTDASGTIVWADGSDVMRRRAAAADFVPGADWSEGSAGTNAPALSLVTDAPSSVFSGEHWAESVHDWVCYAAPVHDGDGRVVGALDLSATWSSASSLARGTVQAMARLLDRELAAAGPAATGGSPLQISLLGNPRVALHGREISLPLRQLEILAVLALEGDCTLDSLHARVYGDRPVGVSTLKGELSQLRKALGGAIGSRPYRLDVGYTVDVVVLDQALRAGSVGAASSAYRGQLLTASEAPSVVSTRHRIDVGLRAALLRAGSADQLLTFAEIHPFDAEVVAVARRRSDESDVALTARLAAATAALDLDD